MNMFLYSHLHTFVNYRTGVNMRSLLSCAIIVCMLLSFVTIAASLPSDTQDVVWVDDDFGPSTPGYGVTHFASLSDGVGVANPDGTLHLAAGDYDACGIPHSLTILGEGRDVVTIDS